MQGTQGRNSEKNVQEVALTAHAGEGAYKRGRRRSKVLKLGKARCAASKARKTEEKDREEEG